MTARRGVGIREVVSAMLVAPDGRLLLQLRDDKPTIPYPKTWTLFGGGVEPGEAPVNAVTRELEEELELRVSLTRWHYFPCPIRSDPGLICLHHCYWGRLTVPLDTLVLHEGQRFELFTPADAMALPMAFDQQDVVRLFTERVLAHADSAPRGDD